MKYIKLVFLLLWVSQLCYAQTAADDLATILTNMQSMQAQFEQQVMDGKGRVMQKSAGKFALQRPGKFRWETLKPINQLLIADSLKIWIYDKDLQQVTVQNQNSQDTNSPAMLLSGSVAALKNNFKVSYSEKSSTKGIWFLLKPIKTDAMFQAVELNFNQNKLAAMLLVDNLGQGSNLIFSQVIINPKLDPALFQFKKPQDVDVVDQTQK